MQHRWVGAMTWKTGHDGSCPFCLDRTLGSHGMYHSECALADCYLILREASSWVTVKLASGWCTDSFRVV